MSAVYKESDREAFERAREKMRLLLPHKYEELLKEAKKYVNNFKDYPLLRSLAVVIVKYLVKILSNDAAFEEVQTSNDYLDIYVVLNRNYLLTATDEELEKSLLLLNYAYIISKIPTRISQFNKYSHESEVITVIVYIDEYPMLPVRALDLLNELIGKSLIEREDIYGGYVYESYIMKSQ